MAVTSAPQAQLYPTTQLSQKVAVGVTTAEWEALLGSMDNGSLGVYDPLYSGAPLSLTETPVSTTSMSAGAWSPDSWDLSGFNINEFATQRDPAQSVLSLSDESLSSGGDDMAGEMGIGLDFHNGPAGLMHTTAAENYILEGLDTAFGL